GKGLGAWTGGGGGVKGGGCAEAMLGGRAPPPSQDGGGGFRGGGGGTAFGLLGHGSLLCTASRTDAAGASSWRNNCLTRGHGVTRRERQPLDRGARSFCDSSRPPRGRRIRSHRARSAGRDVRAHR